MSCGSKGAALGRRRLLFRCRSSRTKNRPASEAQQRPERAEQLSTGWTCCLPGRWATAGRFPEPCKDLERELLQRPAARPEGFKSDREVGQGKTLCRYKASGARRPKAGGVRMEARRAKTWRAFGQGLVHDSRPPKGARTGKLGGRSRLDSCLQRGQSPPTVWHRLNNHHLRQ
ncbi:hypothetical protein SAMN04490185_0028 [Pseudomonas frederiksbergensis]|jgi:hypothetical protein|uniref:Uncharacterized protein n=3 Tax=Pseudomonas TaxID=286 RepID=Q847F7_PSEPU|nr:unknown [Pseudomonas putida]ACQ63534.1 hypothetical protein [Pseudomonas fluorescens]SEB30701.1 hypothetical protein SAMN04490185_0028 [Pseudomonas frederiksbergensis]